MGNDFRDDSRLVARRRTDRKVQTVGIRICTRSYDMASATGGQCSGNAQNHGDAHRAALSAPRLCTEMERGGAQLGLLLPWLTLFRKRKTAQRSCNRRYKKGMSCRPSLFVLFFFNDFSTHQHAHNGRHHQAACPTAGITETVKSFHVGVKIGVHTHAVAVKFQFR